MDLKKRKQSCQHEWAQYVQSRTGRKTPCWHCILFQILILENKGSSCKELHMGLADMHKDHAFFNKMLCKEAQTFHMHWKVACTWGWTKSQTIHQELGDFIIAACPTPPICRAVKWEGDALARIIVCEIDGGMRKPCHTVCFDLDHCPRGPRLCFERVAGARAHNNLESFRATFISSHPGHSSRASCLWHG